MLWVDSSAAAWPHVGMLGLRFPRRFSPTSGCTHVQGISVEELKRGIVGSEGPHSNATQAEFVKFHDDQSTYTGVYARGGPTNVDGNKDLSSLCDRTAADNRGVSTTSTFAKQH